MIPADKHYMVHSYANKQPSLSVHTVLDEVDGNGTNLIEYASTENRLRIYLDANALTWLITSRGGQSLLLVTTIFRGDLNGRSFVISPQPAQPVAATKLCGCEHIRPCCCR